MVQNKITGDRLEFFWAKIDRPTSWWARFMGDECWMWRGATQRGFGYMITGPRVNGKQPTGRVHRISYEMHKGPIPYGRLVEQTCDKRLCVKPAHLKLRRR